MSPSRFSICGLVALTVPLAAGQADFVSADGLHAAGLVKFWQLQLPLEGDQHLTDAYLVDEQLYLATQDGYVFAVHADTGAVRWLRPITRSGYRIWRPCHAGKRVIFVTPTTVLQLDRLTGDGVAKLDLPFAGGSPAASDGTLFYLGGINGRFYAFNVYDQMEEWKAGTQGPVTATPALYREWLFVGSEDGTVSACTAHNKKYRWRARTSGPIVADLAVDANGVYAASQDQSLYLFDLAGGRTRWRARFSGPLYEPPTLTADLAYQFCPDDGLVAVHTAWIGVKERFRWTLPRGRKLLTVDERYAYVLSRDESLFVVQLSDGQIVHQIPAPSFTLAASASKRATLWIASTDGKLFCARPRGVPFVRSEDLRRALLPPGAETGAEETVEAAKPGAAQEEDYLRGSGTGRPVGGKSKISKQHESGGGGG